MSQKFEGLTVKGRLTARNHDTGEFLWAVNNLVVDTGLALLADRLGGIGVLPVTRIALGTDATAPTVGQTALGAEAFRKLFSTTSSPGPLFSATTTILSSEALFIWREVGFFNAASGGVMFSRLNTNYDHPAQGINVDLTYEVTFARA